MARSPKRRMIFLRKDIVGPGPRNSSPLKEDYLGCFERKLRARAVNICFPIWASQPSMTSLFAALPFTEFPPLQLHSSFAPRFPAYHRTDYLCLV